MRKSNAPPPPLLLAQLGGAEGDVLPSNSQLFDLDVGSIVEQFFEALSGFESAAGYPLALQQVASPTLPAAGEAAPAPALVGDPSLGMEGFFEASGGEFPPLIAAVGDGRGGGAKKASAAAAKSRVKSSALRRRLAVFWQTLVQEAEPETLFDEDGHGIADIMSDLFARISG